MVGFMQSQDEKKPLALMPNVPAEVSNFLDQVQEPRYLFYMVTSNSRMGIAECQRILEIDDLKDKFRAVIAYLTREKEILTLGQKIQSDARKKMNKAQREYYLRQQLKAIQEELGQAEETTEEAVEYAARIEKTALPEEAKKEALRELKRLKIMAPQDITPQTVREFLKKEKFEAEISETFEIPGISTGLAVRATGGIKMKVLAAHRAGLTTVILPRKNEGDLDDLPDEIRRAITFEPVDQIDQALKVALAAEKGRK